MKQYWLNKSKASKVWISCLFKNVVFTFLHFHMEDVEGCGYDSLSFSSSVGGNEYSVEDHLCGDNAPAELTFPKGPIKVEFVSDGSRTLRGFKILYEVKQSCKFLDYVQLAQINLYVHTRILHIHTWISHVGNCLLHKNINASFYVHIYI